VASWLLSSLPPILKPAEEMSGRHDAIQLALAAGAGAGAAVTLMLAFRRQRHQEHSAHVTAHLAERNAELAEQVAEHNRYDAAERRVTDLYTKAVEQLGSDKAAVRLGGMYALERLAQDNPGHRQTIVNVLCAYLRMPYTPLIAAEDPTTQINVIKSPANGSDISGEAQVRLTAQRVLTDHLRYVRPGATREAAPHLPQFWDGVSLDLAGAVLIDADFSDCRIVDAKFNEAVFIGVATFNGAVIAGNANFYRATFAGQAHWKCVAFGLQANFNEAMFSGATTFEGAKFVRAALFIRTKFGSVGDFSKTDFAGNAWYAEAIFSRQPLFAEALVRRPHSPHGWPPGWEVVCTSEGTGRLVHKCVVGRGLGSASRPAPPTQGEEPSPS
jgi:uncharacterized protein YjbI with pentapeptide repeats